MGLFSNYFLHGVVFLHKKHATRKSHWRVWPAFDTWHWSRQCHWRFELHGTHQFDWRVELGKLASIAEGCRHGTTFSGWELPVGLASCALFGTASSTDDLFID